MTSHEQPNDRSRGRVEELGYEPRDVSMKVVVASGIGLVALVALGISVAWWVVETLARPMGQAEPLERPPIMFQEELQANQHMVRKRQQELRRRVLDTYGWIDEQNELARIPIRRAIELIVQEGELPEFGEQELQPRE